MHGWPAGMHWQRRGRSGDRRRFPGHHAKKGRISATSTLTLQERNNQQAEQQWFQPIGRDGSYSGWWCGRQRWLGRSTLQELCRTTPLRPRRHDAGHGQRLPVPAIGPGLVHHRHRADRRWRADGKAVRAAARFARPAREPRLPRLLSSHQTGSGGGQAIVQARANMHPDKRTPRPPAGRSAAAADLAYDLPSARQCSPHRVRHRSLARKPHSRIGALAGDRKAARPEIPGTAQISARNCSTVRPASRTIPPRVKALTGLCRGIVRMRTPVDIRMCLP